MATRIITSCDMCKEDIRGEYVNATVYGVEICTRCYRVSTAHDIVKLLKLDDIKIMAKDDWQNAVKITTIKNNEDVGF